MKYDYLIVGAGLFGAVFAKEMTNAGKKCICIDRRNHIGGNIYTENIENIQIHKYGAHIFHTSDKEVWDYVNRYCEFNNFINAPMAVYKNELYNLPFNMNTFSRLWNIKTPMEAKEIINSQIEKEHIQEPENLEEQALSLVGRDVYEKLIKGYTEKQWGKACRDLPSFIIKRIPLRFTYDNNYFNDRYQGIPIEGYTGLIKKLFEDTKVILSINYHDFIKECKEDTFDKIIYTGMIDEYFEYSLGALEYRGLNFETEIYEQENFQGNAVVNYTDRQIEFTRIIEHKHFNPEVSVNKNKTVITREYPVSWKKGMEPYYPVNDGKNNALYNKYLELAGKERKIIFAGRLGSYKYLDMDKIIRQALDLSRELI